MLLIHQMMAVAVVAGVGEKEEGRDEIEERERGQQAYLPAMMALLEAHTVHRAHHHLRGQR